MKELGLVRNIFVEVFSMNEIEQKIFEKLKERKELSTYELAKDLNITWTAIISTCWKLTAEKVLRVRKGERDSWLWSIKG